MPDVISPNDALLTAINNLFEHPDAIQILLGNETLNQAISNYINAAAERLKPESKWREVWTQDSDARNFAFLEGWGLSSQNTQPMVARLIVKFSEVERVARLYGLLWPRSWYERPVSVTEYDHAQMSLLDEASPQPDYGAAIKWGQSRWPEAVRLFEERTTPIEQSDAS